MTTSPEWALAAWKCMIESALDLGGGMRMRMRAAPTRSGGYAARYRGEEVRFDRQPGSRSKGRPICYAFISGRGPECG